MFSNRLLLWQSSYFFFLVVKIGLEEHNKMMEDRILHTLWGGGR